MAVTNAEAATKTLIARVITGFAGGLAIGLLINHGSDTNVWPSITLGAILFSGVVLLAGLGSIRPVILVIWGR
ncbi:MAG: hypothetical protein MUF14_06955 [Hyphomonadaceae bacterium]|jgi:hypothetical protein|nr:hypothetical protein [Hyphomonadaceae bacterium]